MIVTVGIIWIRLLTRAGIKYMNSAKTRRLTASDQTILNIGDEGMKEAAIRQQVDEIERKLLKLKTAERKLNLELMAVRSRCLHDDMTESKRKFGRKTVMVCEACGAKRV